MRVEKLDKGVTRFGVTEGRDMLERVIKTVSNGARRDDIRSSRERGNVRLITSYQGVYDV